MLLEFGEPIGPEMTFPPFAFARSTGTFDVVEVPFTEPPATEILAAALNSFLGIVWFRLALSKESPRLGKFWSIDAAGRSAYLGDTLAAL
jgi:hypothetical protein